MSKHRARRQKRDSPARLRFADRVCGRFLRDFSCEELRSGGRGLIELERMVVEVASGHVSLVAIYLETDKVNVIDQTVDDVRSCLAQRQPGRMDSIDLLRIIGKSLDKYAMRVRRHRKREVPLCNLPAASEPSVNEDPMAALEAHEDLLEVTELFKDAVSAMAASRSQYTDVAAGLIYGSGISLADVGDRRRRRALGALRDELRRLCEARMDEEVANPLIETLAKGLPGLTPRKLSELIDELQACLRQVQSGGR